MDSFSIMLTRAKRYVHAYARASLFSFSRVSHFVEEFPTKQTLIIIYTGFENSSVIKWFQRVQGGNKVVEAEERETGVAATNTCGEI